MKILVSGSTGLVGARLVAELDGDGREVVRLVRRSPSGANEVEWNPAAGVLKAEEIEGCDAVIHLAGENVGSSRWTARKKAASPGRCRRTGCTTSASSALLRTRASSAR